MGKLQLHIKCYEIEKNYDALAYELIHSPAVHRQGLYGSRVLEVLKTPVKVEWSRLSYQSEPHFEQELRKGNFNDGETIQITAPEGRSESAYEIKSPTVDYRLLILSAPGGTPTQYPRCVFRL